MITLPTTEIQRGLQQQTVNINLPIRRESNRGTQEIPGPLKEEADATYTAALRRLLILGGVSGSTALGLTVVSSTDLGVDNRVFSSLGYTCLGFTLGCLSAIAIAKIFLRRIKEIHESISSVKELMQTTSFIPLRRSLSSPALSSPYLDYANLPLPSNTHLLPIAPHLLPIAPHLLPIAPHSLPIAPHSLPIAPHLLPKRRHRSDT